MEENFAVKEVVLHDDQFGIDKVVLEKNAARTKGFLIGASVVGAGWLLTGLYKKLKNRKVENKTKQSEDENE